MDDYRGKHVIVCGAARSGVAAAKLLTRLGAGVTVYDLKEDDDLRAALANAGIRAVLGKNPDDFDGADAVVLSPGVSRDLPFVQDAAARGVPILGEMELGFAACPNPVVAVTGTNGKTTTTTLVGEILAAYRPGSVTAGNIGTAFADYADNLPEEAFAVLEVSSFQLETADSFRPRVCAVLNVTPDHLNRHKTMDNYRALKERVFARQGAGDVTVLNFDDPLCREMADRTRGRAAFFSRLDEVPRGAFLRGSQLILRWDAGDEPILPKNELRIFGDHNIENALAAIAICAAAGAPTDVIRAGLAAFRGVEHRIEFTRALRGVAYYNDSKATNPDSAIKAIQALDQPILLIAGGRDKDSDYNDWVALFPGRVKLLVTIGEAAPLIENACRAHGFTAYERANSMRDAVLLCAGRAAEGDAVLLSPACASFDMFDHYEQRGMVFKQCVMDL